jgi:hypothetical protein
VKHQRGIVGADMASIIAKRNQTTQIRTAQRTAAIQKAKSEKKEKEAKKPKVRFRCSPHLTACVKVIYEDLPAAGFGGTQNLKAASKGWKGWPLVDDVWYAGFLFFCRYASPRTMQIHCVYKRRSFAPFFRQFCEH